MRPNSSTMTQAEQAVERMNAFKDDDYFDYATFLKCRNFDFVVDHVSRISKPNRYPLLHLIVLTFRDGTRCATQLKDHGKEMWSVLY